MKFLKYFCAASLLAASAGTLWSCDDDDDKRLSDAVLASVSSLTFEAQDTSEKIITVYADADWVTEIPDWVTVTPTEGTGVMDVTVSVSENMRDGAMDNPRKAKLVFKGRTLASRAEVLVSQVGNKFRDIPEYQKIGDVIALDDEAAVKIPSALVMAVTNKGFIISDDQQSGAIFVEDTEKVAVGDKVCVWGTKSSDGAKLPIISCAEKSDDPNREGDKVEVLSSGATVTYPTPTDLTEQIDTYTSAERSYVTVTGFFNGSTVSVADDAKYSVSALDIPEEMGLAKLNGHNITVSGYYAGLAEPVHRIIVTTIVDKGAVETVYWTEDFEWLEPWAIAGDNKGKQAGQTVEKDDLDAYCPQLPTSMVDGVSTLQALEAKGYEFLRVWDPSKDEDECIYLQKNYLKFGKTAYQAGIVLSNIEGVPEGEKTTFSFDWCPMRQGSGKIDPVNLIVSNSKFPPTAGKAVISSNGSRLRSIWRASRSTRIRKSPSSKRNGLLKQRIAGSWTTSRSPRPNKLRSTLSSRQTAVDLHEQRRRPLLFRFSRTPRGAGEAPSQFYLRKYFSITKKLSIFE